MSTINLKGYDLVLEVENGRDTNGSFSYLVPGLGRGTLPPTAVWFIDSHGQSSLHSSLAGEYDHVFFAVWSKRDLFAGHPSAHWCPNATDLAWFGRGNFQHVVPEVDFGFFGSKGGLDRADPLKATCERRGWTYDVREVGKPHRHKWPMTGQAMSRCRTLFNRGQKHDGPNLRVVESMAVGRPLISDADARSGMDRLFKVGTHYLSYSSEGELEARMEFALKNPEEMDRMAEEAFHEVASSHTIANRAHQIMEVVRR